MIGISEIELVNLFLKELLSHSEDSSANLKTHFILRLNLRCLAKGPRAKMKCVIH